MLKNVCCPVCGAQSLQEMPNGFSRCKYCGMYLTAKPIDNPSKIFKEEEEEKKNAFAERKRVLYDTVSERKPERDRIVSLSEAVLEIDQDDILSQFYIAAMRGSERINEFFDQKSREIPQEQIHYVLNCLLRFITDDGCMAWINYWIDTVIEKKSSEKAQQFRVAFQKRMEKFGSDIYVVDKPRDVFLAYSAKDRNVTLEVTRLLEKEGYSCFVAFRNLKRDPAVVENYQAEIRKAIRACKCVVFLSSENSRSVRCDVTGNLTYIYDNCPQIKRIEYVIKPYGDETPKETALFLEHIMFAQADVNTPRELLDLLAKTLREEEPVEIEEVPTEEPPETEEPAETKEFTAYEEQAKTDGSYVFFGRYPQSEKAENVTVTRSGDKYTGSDGEEYLFENDRYFKIEPLAWRILERQGEYATVVAVSSVSAKRFDVNANNYANSEIRKWLNGEFLQKAFSEEEQVLIQTVTVENGERSTNPDGNAVKWGKGKNKYACENTQDKVWLLSVQEVSKESYGFSLDFWTGKDGKRARKATAYALVSGTFTDGEIGTWWLRSPDYCLNNNTRIVDSDGRGNNFDVSNARCGVVPAMKIRLPE